MPIWFLGLVFVSSLATVVTVHLLAIYGRRLQAQREAAEIVKEAKEEAEARLRDHQSRIDSVLAQIKNRSMRDIERVEEKAKSVEESIEGKAADHEERYGAKSSVVSERESQVAKIEAKIRDRQQKFDEIKNRQAKLLEDYISKLESSSGYPRQNAIQELHTRLIDERQVEMNKFIQAHEEQAIEEAERNARLTIDTILGRFLRPYCPERGVGYHQFDNESQRNKVLGKEECHLREVEKLCGVDVLYDKEYDSVNVYGFDPVRRELGRATIERMAREHHVSLEKIPDIFERTKKELMQRIVTDGTKVANELGIKGLHPEILNMMGALRYRYSFTQNQYFHCAEVGFICGLFSSELNLPVSDGRRAGLLHDIGKSMDHAQDGGHAVIGAEFIRTNGEAEHIVHAVKAHHFDEPPNSDLAYLVIAADAISGARPGARRSTTKSFTQKVNDLQTIATAHPGVIDTHVLHAGREMRVYVDSKSIDDLKALDISKQIARKIETDMSYPGQIKVTVVRTIQSVEHAR